MTMIQEKKFIITINSTTLSNIDEERILHYLKVWVKHGSLYDGGVTLEALFTIFTTCEYWVINVGDIINDFDATPLFDMVTPFQLWIKQYNKGNKETLDAFIEVPNNLNINKNSKVVKCVRSISTIIEAKPPIAKIELIYPFNSLNPLKR